MIRIVSSALAVLVLSGTAAYAAAPAKVGSAVHAAAQNCDLPGSVAKIGGSQR